MIADSEEAVELGRAALELCPPGHPNRGASLDSLARTLRTKFEREADHCKLEEIIDLYRAALESWPSEHPGRLSSLQDLAHCLRDRYDDRKEITDLEEAAVVSRAALELCQPGNPDYFVSLSSLALNLRTKFEITADMHDLDEAIVLFRKALELCPPGHPLRLFSLESLVTCLVYRHSNRGLIADSKEEATMLDDTAETLRPTIQPDRGTAELDEAMVLQQEALQLLTPGDPHHDLCQRRLEAIQTMKIQTPDTDNTPSPDTPPAPVTS